MAKSPSFGTQFTWARGRRRQTQQEVADLIGVDRKTVDNWEHDRTEPARRYFGLIYEWAPELAEDMPEDEAEFLARLTSLYESSFIEESEVDRLMSRYRAAKRRARGDGAAGNPAVKRAV